MNDMEKILICDKIVDEVMKKNSCPACRMELTQEPYLLTDSHLGGIPYIPHEGSIPTNENGNQLWLCAQINFSQMPDMKYFPKEGILQLFLSDWNFDGGFGLYSNDETDQKNWRVIYYDTIDETVTKEEVLSKMEISWEEAQQINSELWRTPDIPLKIYFNPVEQEKINHTDFRFDQKFDSILKESLPTANPLEYYPYRLDEHTIEERTVLYDIYKKINNGGCKLGGYPRNEQDDPRDYGDNENLNILLFQLDDDTFTYPIGSIDEMAINLNGGTLNLFINHEDLEKTNFSHVLCYWACS